MTIELLEPATEDLSSLSLGDLMRRKRAQIVAIKCINDDLKEAKAVELALDEAIVAKLDEAGTTASRVEGIGTAALKSSVVPNVKDWDAFHQYIAENGYFHLLDRRPNAAGCREAFERFGAIPGVEPFNKRTLSFTAA
jgi:hypothetical protein